ncbi:Phage integrase family protein [Geodermatophilus africanus]|uniref:Phage integrase family protein n=1 Tax=Geodermatophilus africanus TaxID=1137993 RepID=A0A1H3DBQ1_9ACTN|nr:tyrosine-type recombinase/integrase [Geodermatophilus africanus]SDX63942.1 Phage integrase family protein [Geodermatophilus africanus]
MAVDLAALLPSWELHLRAERRSPETVKSYGDGVLRFLTWADGAGRPAVLDRASVNALTADLLEAGAEPATARARQLALRRFSAWLREEGESDADSLLGLKAPRLDAKVVEPLAIEQIKALVAACAGRELRDRRDEALVRLMVETGARAGEVVALGTEDVDLSTGTATVRRGKGGRGRVAPSARRPPGRWTATSGPVAATDWSTPRRCGSATAARRSPTTRCTRRWASGPARPGSRGSGRTGCGTPQYTAGSPPAAARVDSWRWPAGRGRTCYCATRARRRRPRAAAEARALGLGDF